MKNLRREKSGGFTWRPNLAVLAPAIGAVVDEVPLGMNTLPTLAIYGGKSNYVNTDDLDQFQSACMQFQFHEIEGAGHWLHASHPDEFFEEVEDFLGA
jgi:pimeloyl-ACP methyl ester carboxylesterase